jgi:hypothetical protein
MFTVVHHSNGDAWLGHPNPRTTAKVTNTNEATHARSVFSGSLYFVNSIGQILCCALVSFVYICRKMEALHPRYSLGMGTR